MEMTLEWRELTGLMARPCEWKATCNYMPKTAIKQLKTIS
jgi:hypothetical protein